MEKIRTILKAQISLLTFILLFISLNSFSANVKFYNISDIYGITSGEAFSVCKDQYGFIWASTKTPLSPAWCIGKRSNPVQDGPASD